MRIKNTMLASMVAIMFGLTAIAPAFSASFSSSSRSSSGFTAPSRPSAPSMQFNRPSPSTFAPSSGATQNGFTKPNMAPSTTTSNPPAAQSQNEFTKPGSTATVQPSQSSGRAPPPNALSTAQTRNMSSSSLASYQAERAQAKQPPMPIAQTELRSNPVMSSARNSYGGNVDTYMSRRATTYDTYRTSHASTFVIVHEIRPNYGIYDSSILTGMVMGVIGTNMAQNAMWMNAQQNQPWYSQYRADLNQQAQTNEELRNKLAILDKEMSDQQAQGHTVNVDSPPPGIDPSMFIAPEAVITDSDFSQTPNQSNTHILVWVLLLLSIFGVIGIIYFIRR